MSLSYLPYLPLEEEINLSNELPLEEGEILKEIRLETICCNTPAEALESFLELKTFMLDKDALISTFDFYSHSSLSWLTKVYKVLELDLILSLETKMLTVKVAEVQYNSKENYLQQINYTTITISDSYTLITKQNTLITLKKENKKSRRYHKDPEEQKMHQQTFKNLSTLKHKY